MDSTKIVFLIDDQVRLVKVSYDKDDVPPSSGMGLKRDYSFKTLDQTLAVDDYVEVETGTRHGLTVCKVTEVDLDVDFDDGIPLKWAFQRVDSDMIEDIRAKEAEAIAAAKRIELKRKREQLREGIFAEHTEMLKGLALTSKQLPAE